MERLGQWQQLIRIARLKLVLKPESEEIRQKLTWSICGERVVNILSFDYNLTINKI